MIHGLLLSFLAAAVVIAPMPRPERNHRRTVESDGAVTRERSTRSFVEYRDGLTRFTLLPQTAFDGGRAAASRVFVRGLEKDGRTAVSLQTDREEERCVQEAKGRDDRRVSEACSSGDEQRCEDVRRRSAAQLGTDLVRCEREAAARAEERAAAAERAAREAEEAADRAARREAFEASGGGMGLLSGVLTFVLVLWLLGRELRGEAEEA